MNNLNERLQQVRLEIAEAGRQFGREPGSVKLLAVSKTRNADDVLAMAQLGVSDFGENYAQEARAKMGQLRELFEQGRCSCLEFPNNCSD